MSSRFSDPLKFFASEIASLFIVPSTTEAKHGQLLRNTGSYIGANTASSSLNITRVSLNSAHVSPLSRLALYNENKKKIFVIQKKSAVCKCNTVV